MFRLYCFDLIAGLVVCDCLYVVLIDLLRGCFVVELLICFDLLVALCLYSLSSFLSVWLLFVCFRFVDLYYDDWFCVQFWFRLFWFGGFVIVAEVSGY